MTGMNAGAGAVADMVNYPPHYRTAMGIEAIDVMERYGLGLHLGTAFKYLVRAGRKSVDATREDLAKAHWYVDRWLGSEMADLPAPAVSMVFSPVTVVAAFELTGARADAVTAILGAALAGDPVLAVINIEDAARSLQVAIAELDEVAA